MNAEEFPMLDGSDATHGPVRQLHGRLPRALLGAGLLGLALAGPSWARVRPPEPPAAPATSDTDAATEQAIQRAYDLSAAFQRVAKNVSPTVVSITVKKVAGPGGGQQQDEMLRRFFGPNFRSPQPQAPEVQEGSGSGVIVTADGYIVTNNHVVEGATLVTVSNGENTKFTAKVVGTDPASDIAVIKIEGESFPFSPLGDSDLLNVGEWVVAIGNPFGLNHTVTAGIVSAKGRVQPDMDRVRFQDFIQTDAAINPGNSGGPLLNLRGQVIGINSAFLSRAGGNIGIGFAIPSNLASSVMTQLIDSGKVQRGYVGIVLQDLDDDLAKSFGFRGTSGAVVAEVAADSPAEAAGLKSGDIITKVGNRSTPNVNSLRNAIAAIAPGKSAAVEVFREGKTLSLDVTVGNRDQISAETSGSAVGVTVADVTPEVLERLRDIRAPKGVLVTKVDPESEGARAGLRVDDLILGINRDVVSDVAEFLKAAEGIDATRGARLTVRTRGQTRYVFLPPR